MRSGFRNPPSTSASKPSSTSTFGSLRDLRPNPLQLPTWCSRASSSLSTDGPTGHHGELNNHNNTTTQQNTSSTWGATTTTTTAGVQIPTKKQKKNTPPPAPAKVPHPLPPKAALNAWYGKRHQNMYSPNSCFTTWNDGGMPHILKFTSVFTCPVTGERFCSGRYGDAKYYTAVREKESGVEVVWYSKKTLAEQGAAARALDCFALREDAGRFCLEIPYMTPDDAPPLPHSCPDSLFCKNDANMSMDVTNEKDDGRKKHKDPGRRKVKDENLEKNEQRCFRNQENNTGLAIQMQDSAEEEECEKAFHKLQNEYAKLRKGGGAGLVAASNNGTDGVSILQTAKNDASTTTTENTSVTNIETGGETATSATSTTIKAFASDFPLPSATAKGM